MRYESCRTRNLHRRGENVRLHVFEGGLRFVTNAVAEGPSNIIIEASGHWVDIGLIEVSNASM